MLLLVGTPLAIPCVGVVFKETRSMKSLVQQSIFGLAFTFSAVGVYAGEAQYRPAPILTYGAKFVEATEVFQGRLNALAQKFSSLSPVSSREREQQVRELSLSLSREFKAFSQTQNETLAPLDSRNELASLFLQQVQRGTLMYLSELAGVYRPAESPDDNETARLARQNIVLHEALFALSPFVSLLSDVNLDEWKTYFQLMEDLPLRVSAYTDGRQRGALRALRDEQMETLRSVSLQLAELGYLTHVSGAHSENTGALFRLTRPLMDAAITFHESFAGIGQLRNILSIGDQLLISLSPRGEISIGLDYLDTDYKIWLERVASSRESFYASEEIASRSPTLQRLFVTGCLVC